VKTLEYRALVGQILDLTIHHARYEHYKVCFIEFMLCPGLCPNAIKIWDTFFFCVQPGRLPERGPTKRVRFLNNMRRQFMATATKANLKYSTRRAGKLGWHLTRVSLGPHVSSYLHILLPSARPTQY
jgi:hypothetical protein